MMNQIVDWLRKERLGARYRRIEILGGHSGQEPRITFERFEPDLDKASRIKGARDKVAQMGAASFDDATGNALETLIDYEGEDWRHELDRQHHAYRASASQRLEQAYGVVWQYRQLLDEDLTKLRHSEMAVETAVLALSGSGPDGAGDM